VHDACLRLLAARPRSRSELESRLRSKGAPDAVTAEVLDRLAGAGLVDDTAFADSWVRARHQYSGRGRRALAHELRGKGVADDVVAGALEQVDDESEAERARELARRAVGRRAVPEDAAGRAALVRRTVGMLARRGYGAADSLRITREEVVRAAGEHVDDEDDLLPDPE
jgi:regulatory protein